MCTRSKLVFLTTPSETARGLWSKKSKLLIQSKHFKFHQILSLMLFSLKLLLYLQNIGAWIKNNLPALNSSWFMCYLEFTAVHKKSSIRSTAYIFKYIPTSVRARSSVIINQNSSDCFPILRRITAFIATKRFGTNFNNLIDKSFPSVCLRSSCSQATFHYSYKMDESCKCCISG